MDLKFPTISLKKWLLKEAVAEILICALLHVAYA
jgi:hypothetical protein